MARAGARRAACAFAAVDRARRIAAGAWRGLAARPSGTSTPARRSSSRRLAACSMRLMVAHSGGARRQQEQRQADPRQRIPAARRNRKGSRSARAVPCASGPRRRSSTRCRAPAARSTSRSVRTSKNVGQTWLAAKLANKSGRQRDQQRDRAAATCDSGATGLRRHPRRIDQPEIGAGRRPPSRREISADFAPRDQALVVLLVDVVVAIELRELGLDLRHRSWPIP